MLVVGLMSGTSMDAIDAALVEITPEVAPETEPEAEPRTLRMQVRHFLMAPLDPALRERVRDNDGPVSSTGQALRWVARGELATLGLPAPIRKLLGN